MCIYIYAEDGVACEKLEITGGLALKEGPVAEREKEFLALAYIARHTTRSLKKVVSLPLVRLYAELSVRGKLGVV